MSIIPVEEKDIENTEIVCRYCLDSNGDSKINPCDCKNFVHKECLTKWLEIKKNNTCELCKKEYKNLNIDIRLDLFYNKFDDFIKTVFCRSQHWSPIHYTHMQLNIFCFVTLSIIILVIYVSITCSVKNCRSFRESPTNEPTHLPTNELTYLSYK